MHYEDQIRRYSLFSGLVLGMALGAVLALLFRR